MAGCRKPVIAAVSGWCIGGGVDVIAAADIRLASADAKFSIREVKVAIVADLGSLQRLAGIIGEGHLRELAFTGKDIDAARAEKIGLVNDVYPDQDAVLAAARELAADIAANPPLVVQGVKDVLGQRPRAGRRRGFALRRRRGTRRSCPVRILARRSRRFLERTVHRRSAANSQRRSQGEQPRHRRHSARHGTFSSSTGTDYHRAERGVRLARA